jgi:hypothetical protein
MEYGSNFCFYKTKNKEKSVDFHENAIYYGCGRYAINDLISHYVNLGAWKKIFVPEYYCMDVVHSISKTGINVVTYKDNPTIVDDQKLILNKLFEDGDVLLRMNFFGLRSHRSNDKINIPVIEDHSHGLFSNWALLSNADWCFASIRKSLPVADGGILWSPKNNSIPIKENVLTNEHKQLAETRYAAMRMKLEYLSNNDEELKDRYLKLFSDTEELFADNSNSVISPDTLILLNKIPSSIDDSKKRNFEYFLVNLDQDYYSILIPDFNETVFSLVLILENESIRDDLKIYLIKNNIYPAVLWELDESITSQETILVSTTHLSVHIDFRYSLVDIGYICNILNEYAYDAKNN